MGGDRSHDREPEPPSGLRAMILPKADWEYAPGMASLLDVLGAGREDTRFVGGCVRDTLLGLRTNDVDLTTRLAPDEVLGRLRRNGIKALPTGLAHGTVTALLPTAPVEITTLRRDVSTDGRRASIAYTDDWREDAARRDFTINALSAHPAGREVFDYFAGLEDLKEGRVRFIGDPLTRIAEDHLRILRYFRFHARFGQGDPDHAALEACRLRANDLMALSRERIADELLKLLAFPDPTPVVALMLANGILRPVLPEIEGGATENLRHLVDREAAAGVVPEPLRRLAALLPRDPDAAASVAARLRLSNKALKRLVSAASRSGSDEADAQTMAYRIGAEEAVDRMLLGGGDLADVARLRGWQRPKLKLGGGDLIAMGLQPGPLVAKTLQTIERAWSQAGFTPDEEEQRALARQAVDQALRESQ